MNSKEVLVSLALPAENIMIGKLWFYVKNRKERASFEYDKAWLMHPERFALEPALHLTQGAFHVGHGLGVFGSIGDSAPDRWGRVLMRRRETFEAKEQKRAPKTLMEYDYLLGVHDEARQGALRFSWPSAPDVFVASEHKTSIPPLIELPRLLSATHQFLDEEGSHDDLRLLFLPGSSLGGARPKASVRDHDGSLAIAKFPKKDDDFQVVVWEAVALILAKKAGLRVPKHRLELVSEKPVLVINRFDRHNNERIPFLSAMSLLEAKDNEQHSYLELAHALIQHGSSPEKDLKELWRRIVFSIMISNTDDHLRNHGFLYESNQGWSLSPVYDLNPTPLETAPHVLTTAIDFHNQSASFATALKVAHEFRLKPDEAHAIIESMRQAVSQWRHVARGLGVSAKECDRMSDAFRDDPNDLK